MKCERIGWIRCECIFGFWHAYSMLHAIAVPKGQDQRRTCHCVHVLLTAFCEAFVSRTAATAWVTYLESCMGACCGKMDAVTCTVYLYERRRQCRTGLNSLQLLLIGLINRCLLDEIQSIGCVHVMGVLHVYKAIVLKQHLIGSR